MMGTQMQDFGDQVNNSFFQPFCWVKTFCRNWESILALTIQTSQGLIIDCRLRFCFVYEIIWNLCKFWLTDNEHVTNFCDLHLNHCKKSWIMCNKGLCRSTLSADMSTYNRPICRPTYRPICWPTPSDTSPPLGRYLTDTRPALR